MGYEDEVDSLKSQRGELVVQVKELEKNLERSRQEAEQERIKVKAIESEMQLQKRHVETAERQSHLVTKALEGLQRGGGQQDLRGVREELDALSVGGPRQPPNYSGSGVGYG